MIVKGQAVRIIRDDVFITPQIPLPKGSVGIFQKMNNNFIYGFRFGNIDVGLHENEFEVIVSWTKEDLRAFRMNMSKEQILDMFEKEELQCQYYLNEMIALEKIINKLAGGLVSIINHKNACPEVRYSEEVEHLSIYT